VRNALGLPVPDPHWSQELRDAGLSLMGRHDELDYFEDDSEPDTSTPLIGAGGVGTRVMPRALAVERLRMARRARMKGAIGSPVIEQPSGPADLLAGILNAQTQLLTPATAASSSLQSTVRNLAARIQNKPRPPGASLPSPVATSRPPCSRVGLPQGEVGDGVKLTKAAAVTGGTSTNTGAGSGPRYGAAGTAVGAGAAGHTGDTFGKILSKKGLSHEIGMSNMR
jgi:hypothetical protein